MLRLLQGDVGSGKTVVALLAMLNAVESGAQAALMAHRVAGASAPRGHRQARRSGRRARRAADRAGEGGGSAIRAGRPGAGEIGIVVGTHALLQDAVAFRDAGCHRRAAPLRRRSAPRFGEGIGGGRAGDVGDAHSPHADDDRVWRPRRLAADREAAGRQPIDTRVAAIDRLDELVAAVGRMLGAGAKVYWVCPLVEDWRPAIWPPPSSATTSCSAPSRPRRSGARAMKTAERDAAMRAFRDGPVGVLVATTIEVGVDVPAAAVMVIEHAERFGLAQLHQLRGRIGRGAAASTCVLLYAPPISDAPSAAHGLRETDDARIAEEDPRLRGAANCWACGRALARLPRRRSRAPRRTAGGGTGRRPAVAGARPRPYEPARPRPAHPPIPLRARPRSEDASRRMRRALLLIRPARAARSSSGATPACLRTPVRVPSFSSRWFGTTQPMDPRRITT